MVLSMAPPVNRPLLFLGQKHSTASCPPVVSPRTPASSSFGATGSDVSGGRSWASSEPLRLQHGLNASGLSKSPRSPRLNLHDHGVTVPERGGAVNATRKALQLVKLESPTRVNKDVRRQKALQALHTELQQATAGSSIERLVAAIARAEVLGALDWPEATSTRARLKSLKELEAELEALEVSIHVQQIRSAIHHAQELHVSDDFPHVSHLQERLESLTRCHGALAAARHASDPDRLVDSLALGRSLGVESWQVYSHAEERLRTVQNLEKDILPAIAGTSVRNLEKKMRACAQIAGPNFPLNEVAQDRLNSMTEGCTEQHQNEELRHELRNLADRLRSEVEMQRRQQQLAQQNRGKVKYVGAENEEMQMKRKKTPKRGSVCWHIGADEEVKLDVGMEF